MRRTRLERSRVVDAVEEERKENERLVRESADVASIVAVRARMRREKEGEEVMEVAVEGAGFRERKREGKGCESATTGKR